MGLIEQKIIKLPFSGPLHLSRGKAEMDTADPILHSDKIKSAIAAAAYVLFHEWSQAEKEAFFQAFKVSSAFPYWKDVLFFPTPTMLLPDIEGVDEWKQGKKKKKIKYLDQPNLEAILNGEQPATYPASVIQGINADESKDLVICATELPKDPLIASEVTLRVNVPRDRVEVIEQDAGLYYQERLFFGNEVGLYFCLEYEENGHQYEDSILAAIQFLGDSGIGSDRTNGNGHFDFNKDQHFLIINLRVPDHPTRQVLFSLYCPAETDDLKSLLKDSSYHILKRGGYIAQPLQDNYLSYRKKSIHMFGEGSIFSKGQSEGVIHDLQPESVNIEHPIWRDGRPIFLPLK